MSFKPPFARMRAIKKNAAARQRVNPTPESLPTSVDEALQEKKSQSLFDKFKPRVLVEETTTQDEEDILDFQEGEDGEDLEEDKEDPLASMEMSRTELNSIATELGIENPEKLPTKKAVLEAILTQS